MTMHVVRVKRSLSHGERATLMANTTTDCIAHDRRRYY